MYMTAQWNIKGIPFFNSSDCKSFSNVLWATSGTPTYWHQFRAARRRLHHDLKTARDIYMSEYLGDAIEENPKRFWSYVKQLKQDNLGVADLEIDGILISDDKLSLKSLISSFLLFSLTKILQIFQQ
ncbi:Hypothetical predicted protein [Paramuricea clavata]|uniref:Uncharacterized protein n=1 Tax=Paramuricea clavata TaxID=317549 RepID=A0A7D9IY15_PARCT|nr:Hypothetical predicted protein [Paramuricea clavata]